MAFQQPHNRIGKTMRNDEVQNSNFITQFKNLTSQRNGCDLLISQPKLVDWCFSDSEMNNLLRLAHFFQFISQSLNVSKTSSMKLIIRLPGSNLLKFAYSFIKHSTFNNSSDNILWEQFICDLSKVLYKLLEINPISYDQMDSLGIFDRLEISLREISDTDVQFEVKSLISYKEQLRLEHETKRVSDNAKTKDLQETELPPPDDFHQLSIYPTLNDIFHEQMPYLRKNITTGLYQNGTHYLDIHFRLLREDFLAPLRQAVCEYITAGDQSSTFRNVNVRLYRNVMLLGSVCTHNGLLYSLQMDTTKLPKSISWSNSRRLIYGNLLAATFDDFETSCFLVTVEDRSNVCQNGILSVRCQRELCDHKLMQIPPGKYFTLLETTSYFEAYRPVLQALQSITNDRIPLEKHLLQCDADVPLPHYFREKSTIDFRPILIKSMNIDEAFQNTLSDVKDSSTWPNARQLGLDDSQYKAMQLALTKSVALIQGPPGCGKTFLGVRLAELFYHNRQRIVGCQRPILMICYTNHALDQFLASIIDKVPVEPGEIVRVGGRSSHVRIEPFLIQKLRQSKKDMRLRNAELPTKYDLLQNIKKQIDDCITNYYKCSETLLDADQLLRVMDRNQFLSLINPILPKLDIFCNHWDTDIGGIYCCRQARDDLSSHESTDGSQSDDENMNSTSNEPLSYYEKQRRMVNRKDCHKLNDLSEADRKEINVLFSKWLEAADLTAILEQIKAEVQDNDDGDGDFQVQRKRRKTKHLEKASSILISILSDGVKAVATDVPNVNTKDENVENLDEDEEELRRLENVDNFISFTGSATMNDRRKQEYHSASLAHLENLVNNKSAMMSDAVVRRIPDLWSAKTDAYQRKALYCYWLAKYVEFLQAEWLRLNEQYDEISKSVQGLQLENDRLYLDDAFIIAMTTHCASRYQRILKQIAPRICMIEEAAEVFESHVVTAIGEHCEHLILIGDHIQLRPSTNVYTLAKDFNLDVSLFERLIKNKMPSVQLCVQHRSIPIISSLVHHFYDIPILNHESVLNRPPITGIRHPLYFISHQHFEENVLESSSKKNIFESEYVVRLAEYLIHQGYQTSDITILTTYMGQRQQIKNTMNRLPHLKGIHVTVVDNFQGEENRIILLSLVRSNADQRLGYVAVDNRICVALSRAQNGFYVIGNFHLLTETSKTWKFIVQKMKERKLIGPGLPINCVNHPNDNLICIDPNDFAKRPLGGCGLRCETRLSCGHQCSLTCHSTSHDKLVCNKLCLRAYADCEHLCRKKCHSTTACVPCDEIIHVKMVNCEHTCHIPCFKRKNDQMECTQLVEFICPVGHNARVRCSDVKDAELKTQLCTQPCNFTLECGHRCKGTCSKCLEGRFHRPCCEKKMVVYVCGHSQERRCHEVGPRCEEQFMKACEDHDDTPMLSVLSGMDKCNIFQCNRYCKSRCKHMRCSQRCKLECDRDKCYEKCTKRFPCEHYCNGICGEPCISCLPCRFNTLPIRIQQAIHSKTGLRYSTFVELPCGHLYQTEYLDKYIEDFAAATFLPNGFMLADYPRCPECQVPMIKCKRYSSIIKKIQHKLSKVTIPTKGFPIFLSMTKISSVIGALKKELCVLESVRKVHNNSCVNKRNTTLSSLFLYVVNLFREFTDEVATERDAILEAVYKQVEGNQSLFFTRQQWSDLENEYNRIQTIVVVKLLMRSNELMPDDVDYETINDILSGPNLFSKLAFETCTSLIKMNRDKKLDLAWKSILPDRLELDDFEEDQLTCDGKWFVCPQEKHLVRHKTNTAQLTCNECENDETSDNLSHSKLQMTSNFRGRPFRRRQ